MSEAKHTPGPWRLELLEDRSIKHLCPVGPDDMSILTIVEHDGKPFAAIYEDADASLIAAAPDLLQEAKTLLATIDSWGGTVNEQHLAGLRAATQKAESPA